MNTPARKPPARPWLPAQPTRPRHPQVIVVKVTRDAPHPGRAAARVALHACALSVILMVLVWYTGRGDLLLLVALPVLFLAGLISSLIAIIRGSLFWGLLTLIACPAILTFLFLLLGFTR